MPTREERIAAYLKRVAEKPTVKSMIDMTLSGNLEASESPAATEKRTDAKGGMDQIVRGHVPAPEQASGLEAIILPKIRPVLDVVDGKFHTDHPLWLNLNDDKERARQVLIDAIPKVGRIELPGNFNYPYGGTGFVVGENLIMTNRHVAAIFSSGVGTRQIEFIPGKRAGIDFLRELDRPTGQTLDVKSIKMIHPYWDMALLEVEGIPKKITPLKLSLRDIAAEELVMVAAIGYPAFDTRNDVTVQNDLFRHEFGVKRLQPGTAGGTVKADSFGKTVDAVRHSCSTLGGNSGSALVDLESGEVVALHFGGRYRVINYAVPSSALAKDDRVIQAGVRFEGKPSGGAPSWSEWWSRADENRVAVASASSASANVDVVGGERKVADGVNVQIRRDGVVKIDLSVNITLNLGDAARGVNLDSNSAGERGDELERAVMPWHDSDYSSRKGYNENFIGVKIPMPKAVDPKMVATTKDGADVLHYQNFSIVTHAKRRMSLFTASNVTAEADLRKPDVGRAYTRKGLSGLGEKDQERWFLDPRLGEEYQLPDVFYSGSGFDRGHVVRRDDVAWGSNYELLRRANGDSYHLTNCSPQVPAYNRSSLGEDNWGDLENHVLKSAASERYCQFAGPMLNEKDDFFIGKGGGRNRLRIQIPARYWKVLVVRTFDGVASFGFVLKQDLSNISFEEFPVPENFRRFLTPLAELQKDAGIVFPKIVLNADQYDTNEGVEFALRAGIRRWKNEDAFIIIGDEIPGTKP